MKREILFRGKRTDNGEWVEGDFMRPSTIWVEDYDESTGGVFCDEFEVIPSTVGQYTGLLDKNGVKIFEGDIIGRKTEYDTVEEQEVIYTEGEWWTCEDGFEDLLVSSVCRYLEVTGNIHDR